MCRKEIERGGERTSDKSVPDTLPGLKESALEARRNILATGGFTELRGEGIPCESCETVQQR